MGLIDSGKAHWTPSTFNTVLHDRTIGDYFDEQVEKYRNRSALRFSAYESLNISGVNWTYAVYQNKINEFAKALIAAGFQKGDHIAVWCINLPEWIVLELACAKLGIVLVTMNPALQPQEAKYILVKSDVNAVFVLSDFAKRSYVNELKAMRKDLPLLKMIYTFNDFEDPETISYNKLLAGSKNIEDDLLAQLQSLVTPSDVFQIQFTSGTTGFPKGAMLTHYHALNNAFLTFNRWEICQDDIIFSPLPLFHTAGSILTAFASITVGATYITQPYFIPSDAVSIMKRFGVTHFGGVPTMLQGVLNELEKSSEELKLNFFISGGAPVPRTLAEKLEAKTQAKGIVLMGMTETGGIFSSTGPADSKEQRAITSGQPLPHTEVKIIDPVTQKIQPCNTPGEIVVRGYLVMKGYYNMEEQTNEVLDMDGWLRTGDLGLLDNEGYLNVIGRLKEMLIRGGENIYPREVEDFLITHPKVAEAYVIGVPDEYYGEVPAAVIKLKENQQLPESELIAYCKGNLSHQKTPVEVLFVDSLPLTASGKVQKNELLKQYLLQKK